MWARQSSMGVLEHGRWSKDSFATVLATRDTYTGSVQPYPTRRVCKGVEHKAFLPRMLPETCYQPDTVPAALSSMGNNIDRYLLSWS